MINFKFTCNFGKLPLRQNRINLSLTTHLKKAANHDHMRWDIMYDLCVYHFHRQFGVFYYPLQMLLMAAAGEDVDQVPQDQHHHHMEFKDIYTARHPWNLRQVISRRRI